MGTSPRRSRKCRGGHRCHPRRPRRGSTTGRRMRLGRSGSSARHLPLRARHLPPRARHLPPRARQLPPRSRRPSWGARSCTCRTCSPCRTCKVRGARPSSARHLPPRSRRRPWGARSGTSRSCSSCRSCTVRCARPSSCTRRRGGTASSPRRKRERERAGCAEGGEFTDGELGIKS